MLAKTTDPSGLKEEVHLDLMTLLAYFNGKHFGAKLTHK